MCFAVPCEEYKVNPVLARAMDRIFILHADHEQNASTSTVRLAGSSGANPFACIAAGIACLWGPAHGGANEAALNMLAEIGTVDRIPEYIARAKDKNDPFRLMGFGHRVYKNYDPRAKIMQKTTHEVLGELGIKDDPLLEVAMELERIALTDEYFIEKKLYPNIDFYSGITLKALGFPTTMFTVLFALARTVGWIAQWKEMIEDPEQKHRPSAPALHRRAAARLRADRQALRQRGDCKQLLRALLIPCRSTISAAISPDGRSVASRRRPRRSRRVCQRAQRRVGKQRLERAREIVGPHELVVEFRHDRPVGDQVGQRCRPRFDEEAQARRADRACSRIPAARRRSRAQAIPCPTRKARHRLAPNACHLRVAGRARSRASAASLRSPPRTSLLRRAERSAEGPASRLPRLRSALDGVAERLDQPLHLALP